MGQAAISFEDRWKYCKRAIYINQILLSFIIFLSYPGCRKPGKCVARFKGHYGSSVDDTVHGVQLENLIHKDNTGWKMSTESTHFLTLMNDGKTLSSLDGMACRYQCSDQFSFLPGHWQAKVYWISWDLKKLNLFKNNLNKTKNNMKSQIQNKKMVELWNC